MAMESQMFIAILVLVISLALLITSPQIVTTQGKTVWNDAALTSKCRRKQYWDFGDNCGLPLSRVLPKNWRSAAATCRIQFRGKGSNGNDYGLGVVTFMMTYGEHPIGLGGADQPAVQNHRNFIELTDNDSANIILECFGLSCDDLLAYYGYPQDGNRYTIDLADVVATLAPQYLQQTAVA